MIHSITAQVFAEHRIPSLSLHSPSAPYSPRTKSKLQQHPPAPLSRSTLPSPLPQTHSKFGAKAESAIVVFVLFWRPAKQSSIVLPSGRWMDFSTWAVSGNAAVMSCKICATVLGSRPRTASPAASRIVRDMLLTCSAKAGGGCSMMEKCWVLGDWARMSGRGGWDRSGRSRCEAGKSTA